jgi:RNA polymerase sigma-70 factor, ECF subfamily
MQTRLSDDGHARRAGPISTDEVTDAALVCATLAGDPAAIRMLWHRLLPPVRRLLRRFTAPHLELDDLVQEVLSSLFQQLPNLRDPSALRQYTLAISVRVAMHHVRHLRRQRLREAFAVAESAHDSTENVHSQYTLTRLQEVLSRIRERDRVAFQLRFMEHMSTHEIAAALDISVPTARRRYQRARARLKYFAERDPFLSVYLQDVPAASGI